MVQEKVNKFLEVLPWRIGTLKYFEIEIKKYPSGAMRGKWGQIGTNGTKRDHTLPNWTKRGQTGLNGANRAKWGKQGQIGPQGAK